MKNFTQKFIVLFALVFAMSFNINAQEACVSYTPIAQEYMPASPYEGVIQGFEGIDASNGFISTLMLESCKENGLVDAKLSLVEMPSMSVIESVVVSSDLIPARLGGCSTINFGPVNFVFYSPLQQGVSYGLMLEATNGNGGISWQRSSTPVDPSNPYEGGDMYIIDIMYQEMGMPMEYWLTSYSNFDMQFSVCTSQPSFTQADVDAAFADGAASVDITSDNQAVADQFFNWGFNDGFGEGAASVTPEDGITQSDVDAAYEQGVASVTPEDGIGQADVDAAFANGVASVEVPECEEVATQNMPLDLPQGWSMFGYTCLESLDVVEAFSGISDNIEIVKDEWGLAYLPAWGFSAFSNLEFGEGYQIKMIEEVTDFQFCTTIAGGASQDELDAAIAEVHAMYEGWCESDIDNDGVCDSDEVVGCQEENALNYNENATDAAICDYEGCTDAIACNYNPDATLYDGSCYYREQGYDCDGNLLQNYIDPWLLGYEIESVYPEGLSCSEFIGDFGESWGGGPENLCGRSLYEITFGATFVDEPLGFFCQDTCYGLW